MSAAGEGFLIILILIHTSLTNSWRKVTCEYTIYGNESSIHYLIWYNHLATVRLPFKREMYFLKFKPVLTWKERGGIK